MDTGTTIYAMNQMVMDTVTPMTQRAKDKEFANIGAWFSSDLNEKYYMLLNGDLRDYTIFNFITMDFNKGVQELIEVVESRGIVLSIDYNHDHEYFEIWVRHRQDDKSYVYLLFPCSDFIVEV